MNNKKQEENVGIFIDGANMFYSMEGKTIDYQEFKEWLADNRQIEELHYFNAADKADQAIHGFFRYLKNNGYNTHITFLNQINGVKVQKRIDVYLAVKAMLLHQHFNTFILVSGDMDFLPLIHEMQMFGKKIEVISYKKNLHKIYKKIPDITIKYLDDYNTIKVKPCD